MPYREGRIVSFFRSSEMYFSYGQFYIYDTSAFVPAPKWTDEQLRQGFARCSRGMAVVTLHDFGDADLSLCLGPAETFGGFDRVIAVPLEVEGGKVSIQGPEEVARERTYPVPNGSYRVVVAQRDAGSNPDEEDYYEEVRVYFERLEAPLTRSEILVKDAALDPPDVLVEDVVELE